MRVISIGLPRERRRNLHGGQPKRINLPPLTGTPEIMDGLARLLPLAVVCKHSYSPDQTLQLPGSNRGALFPFEYAIPGNFCSYVVLQNTERPAAYNGARCVSDLTWMQASTGPTFWSSAPPKLPVGRQPILMMTRIPPLG